MNLSFVEPEFGIKSDLVVIKKSDEITVSSLPHESSGFPAKDLEFQESSYSPVGKKSFKTTQ
jgi:hypothetical protein